MRASSGTGALSFRLNHMQRLHHSGYKNRRRWRPNARSRAPMSSSDNLSGETMNFSAQDASVAVGAFNELKHQKRNSCICAIEVLRMRPFGSSGSASTLEPLNSVH